MKTLKISELINMLNMVKRDFGDLPVVLSSDSEGNSLGTIKGTQDVGCLDDVIILYPNEEGIDMEDLRFIK
jgi:hypothetical protein